MSTALTGTPSDAPRPSGADPLLHPDPALAAEQITARLLGDPAALPPGTAALPMHPWQAGELSLRPAVAALREQGRLRDLGLRGEPWHPTSSVRTVLRPGTPWMLKLSLARRITNSRRENLRKELHRGPAVHRLLEAGLAAEWRAAHPGSDIVRDSGWIGLDAPGLPHPTGLDTVVRRRPFGPDARVHCVAGLVAEQPLGDTRDSAPAGVVRGLAARTAQPSPAVSAVSAEWLRRYLDAVVPPILRLDGQVASPWKHTSRTLRSCWTPTAGPSAAATATTRATAFAGRRPPDCPPACPVSVRSATRSSPTRSPTSGSGTTSASTTCSA